MNTTDAIRRLAEARHLQRVDQTDTTGTQDALVHILKSTDKKATK